MLRLILTSKINQVQKLTGSIQTAVGSKTYAELPDKPMIEGVVLEGNRTAEELKLQKSIELATEHDIDEIFYGI